MEKRGGSLELEIKAMAKKFLEKSKNKEIRIISHFDTDGITSATIMIRALKKIDRKFSLKIVKNLDDETIYNLPKEKLIIFLDLASNSLTQIAELEIEDVFIIDHHEIIQKIPENINIINPELNEKQKISGSGLTYLFCKEINPENEEFLKLAVLGMIGDMMENNLNELSDEISKNTDIKKKKGLLIYPSTRPINRVLEYCSDPYIPGVTGDMKGTQELLRETSLSITNGRYKSLIELNEEEMSKLVTSIMLRNPKTKNKKIIGDIFLIKFFNQLEDARELSAIVNACSRLGKPELAIQFCMEIPKAKKRAEYMHVKYRQSIISGLKYIYEAEKIIGNGFIIINAKDKIKDTIIGTIASILSKSSLYEEGTIITTMALNETGEKIKVSIRNTGNNTRNLREVLDRVVTKIGGNCGGHEVAAGCVINQEKEREFMELLKKNLEVEVVKI